MATTVTVSEKSEETFPVSPEQVVLQSQITQPEDFTSIPLDGKKKRVPKRVLHFSDGTLEEYSTDEEEEEEDRKKEPDVDPKMLPWGPWFWYYTVLMAKRTLFAADSCGERLAWFFGITSPKYQYAIDEYYRLKQKEEEEERRQQEQAVEMITIKKDFSVDSGGGVPEIQVKKF